METFEKTIFWALVVIAIVSFSLVPYCVSHKMLWLGGLAHTIVNGVAATVMAIFVYKERT